MTTFVLDPRLAAGSMPLKMLTLCELRLSLDARYPWLMLIPQRPDIAEIIDLTKPERAVLFEEITQASTALKAVTGCYKLNVAAIGNVVRQLHVHVVARFENDATWPRTIWGAGDAVAYDTEARDKLARDVLAALP